MKLGSTAANGRSSWPMCGARWRGFALVIAAFLVHPAWSGGPSSEPVLLEAEMAFRLTARLVDERTLELRYVIADGYYMYRDRFRFSINGEPFSIPRQSWPPGKWKQDATFGKVITYRNSVRLLLPVPLSKDELPQADHNSYVLTVSSQGCADVGVCYPPLVQVIEIVQGASGWVRPRSDGNSSGFSRGAQQRSGIAN